MTYLPALRDAARDSSLTGAVVRVYLYLVYEVLDLHEYRPVKHLQLARTLDLSHSTVSDALGHLSETGYLDRIEPDGIRRYRLVYSRLPFLPAHEPT